MIKSFNEENVKMSQEDVINNPKGIRKRYLGLLLTCGSLSEYLGNSTKEC